MKMAENMLQLDDIHTYYEESYVLQGISLDVKEGSVVALLGRNGAGKTTTIRSIIGFTPPRTGKVYFKGRDITGLPSYQIARRGIGLIPQGRQIFPSLSVRENLIVAARAGSGEQSLGLEQIYSTFPILKERASCKARLLSGGEQSMLTISRALMTNPELLLMDEPSEGLAPIIIREIIRIIGELKERGLSILLVEQNLSMALEVADYVYVINTGRKVYEGTPDELWANTEVRDTHLGLS